MAAVIENDAEANANVKDVDPASEDQTELQKSKDDPKAETEAKSIDDNEKEDFQENDGENESSDKKDDGEKGGNVAVVTNVMLNDSKDKPLLKRPASKSESKEVPSTKRCFIIDSRYHKKRSERINSDDEDEDYDFGGPNPFGGMDEMGNWHEPGSPY